MRTNTGLWWLLSGFFLLMAVVYTVWAIFTSPDQSWHTGLEPVGTVALLFTCLMSALIAFYVGRVHTAQGGELPEDILTADIDDGDPELGEFSPWSWWPIVLASSAAHPGNEYIGIELIPALVAKAAAKAPPNARFIAGDAVAWLRRRAEAEHRSMQEVAREAVREYVSRHDHDEEVDRAAAWVTTTFREALDRLGKA